MASIESLVHRDNVDLPTRRPQDASRNLASRTFAWSDAPASSTTINSASPTRSSFAAVPISSPLVTRPASRQSLLAQFSAPPRSPSPPASAHKSTASLSSSAAIDAPRSAPTAQASRAKRLQISAACTACRKNKAKCSGRRPKCERCEKRQLNCSYDVEPGVTRAVAMRRRYDHLREDADQLRDLFEYLRTRPERDALEILRRIRSASNPHVVLNIIRDGELLLSRPSLSPASDAPLQAALQGALQQSRVKVDARHWTSVADDALVSDLIDTFLTWEIPLGIAFIDVECFLDDLCHAPDPTGARFCSPLLVNAMCAQACFISRRVKTIDAITGNSLGDRFFAESKQWLEKEQGRTSLCNVQGLYLMFMYSSCVARDRVGSFYRYTACEMVRQLRPERLVRPDGTQSAAHDDPDRDRISRAISVASWGLFCGESLLAFVYMQPVLLPPPAMPRCFRSAWVDAASIEPVSALNPDLEAPSFTTLMDTICDMAHMMYDIMAYSHNDHIVLGSREDVNQRLRLYKEVIRWERDLQPALDFRQRATAANLHIRTRFHMLVIAIFRQLQSIPVELPSHLSSAAQICLTHCSDMIRETEEHVMRHPQAPNTFVLGFTPFTVCFTLLPQLALDPRTHYAFARSCAIFQTHSSYFPVANYLLRCIQAASQVLKIHLPREAYPFFHGLRLKLLEEEQEVPISFVVLQRSDTPHRLPSDVWDASRRGISVGELIALGQAELND